LLRSIPRSSVWYLKLAEDRSALGILLPPFCHTSSLEKNATR
jgi:hypothetical protein